MKMKTEHFDYMKVEIEKSFPGDALGKCRSCYEDDGLSHVRFRWDIMRAANLTSFLCGTLYKYLNDDHIDTALRKITGTKK